MTIEQAIRMKDDPKWGLQNGLLSASEMVHLCRTVNDYTYRRSRGLSILEVGHYMGLSTNVILYGVKGDDQLLSIDAHIADGWVPKSDPGQYFSNMYRRKGLSTLIMDSRGVQRLEGFDVVFYDGDHADEQRRWTEMVIASETVDLFIFDDRDFDVPTVCCQMLRDAGWKDQSPDLRRLPNDKRDPQTMTLGVFRRQ